MNDRPSHPLKSPLVRWTAAIVALLMALGGAIALKGTHQADAKMEPFLVAVDPETQLPTPGLRRRMGWLKDLDLTADQMQKIQAIRYQSKEQIERQRQASQQAQQELRSLMLSDAPVEQIREKYRQLKILRDQLADMQFDSLLATRQVLNPDQRRKFVERMQQRKEPSGKEPRS